MIKVIFENINCHINSEFLFEGGRLTLIKGDSGIGKSSIFQGISHGLYGNIRGICNFNASKYSITLIFPELTIYRKSKPNILQLFYNNDNLTIYENKVAQSMINQHFGTEDVWNVTCYLEQDTRSLLLGGSNNERMDILNKLSFWSDNPDVHLEKIDMEIKIQQDLFKNEQSMYNAECSLFTEQLTNKPLSGNHYMSKEDIDAAEKDIKDTVSILENLNLELANQNRLAGSIDILKSKLSNVENSLKSYDTEANYEALLKETNDVLENDQLKLQKLLSTNLLGNVDTMKESLANKINECLSLISQKQMLILSIRDNSFHFENLTQSRAILEQELENKKALVPIEYQNRTFTRMELYTIIEYEKQRQIGISACQELKVAYNESSVGESIEHLKSLVKTITDYKTDLEYLRNINQIEGNVLSLGNIFPVDNSIIVELEQKLNSMMLSQGILSCPHCNKSIRYIQGKLHPESVPQIPKEQIDDLQNMLNNLRINANKATSRDNYMRQIDQLVKLLKHIKPNEHGILTPIEMLDKEIPCLGLYENIIQRLRSIKVLPKPETDSAIVSGVVDYRDALEAYLRVDPKVIDNYKNSIELYKSKLKDIPEGLEDNLKLWKQELSDIESNINSMRIKYNQEVSILKQSVNNLNISKNDISQRISRLAYLNSESISLSKQIAELTIKTIPNIPDKIVAYGTRVSDLKSSLERASYYNQMYQRQLKLQGKSEDLLSKSRALSDLYSLKQTAFDLECDHLQTTVDSINESMNDILQDIFEKPIKVLLQLYKKNKTNDKIKANVSLNIQYDGNEYDNMNKLSGGEKDRISFALTLALSRINASPMLLLDETLKSLNESYRVLCVDVMKKFLLPHKTILCINHADVEGNYDNVITL